LLESYETRTYGQFNFRRYAEDVWQYRHLSLKLAVADLEARFRRSKLGVIWVMIHPLMFTTIYSAVLVNLFKVSTFADFSLYVFTGLILWDAIGGFLNYGAGSILQGAGYLKQAPVPMVSFCIRVSITVMVVFLLSMLSYIIYAAVLSSFFDVTVLKVGVQALWIFPIVFSLFVFGLSMATLMGFANLKFRDTTQILVLVLQVVWFTSPIFFQRDLFDKGFIAYWSHVNPVLAFMDMLRASVLTNTPQDPKDWLVAWTWIILSWCLAAFVVSGNDRKAIHGL
jgi:lipopolysaccharide transport system permease protein